MPYVWLCGVVLIVTLLTRLSPAPAAPGPSGAPIWFGMQSVPKFDEAQGRGSWSGTRTRGLLMHSDLGVQLSREGYPWPLDEPEAGIHPNQADFDDAMHSLQAAGIAVELMITDTPFWASSAPDKRPDQPETYRHAPPLNLYEPLFDDGTDIPGPSKRLNPRQHWGLLLTRIAQRYRGAVRYYQIWNEPDYPSGSLTASRDPARAWQGSVADYVRLFEVASIAVHHADPEAKVVTGGLGHAAYLEGMLAHGIEPFLDAVDFHAYGDQGSDNALRAFLSLESRMRQVLLHRGLRKPMFCSESGYPSTEPEAQAAYIPKLFGSALALGLEGVVYYSNTNPSWRQMGLVDWGTMRQRTSGYWAYKTASRALGGLSFAGKLALPPQLVGYRFRDARSAREVQLVWAPFRTGSELVPWRWPGQGSWRQIDPLGHEMPLHEGQDLAIGETPCWFESDARIPYSGPQPNPPRMVGAFAISGVRASAADGSGFHPPDLGIDGDRDSSWVSGGASEAWFEIKLASASLLRGVSFKTGPLRHASLEWSVTDSNGREASVLKEVRVQDWDWHELRFPQPHDACVLRLTWRFDREAAREPAQLFELEPR